MEDDSALNQEGILLTLQPCNSGKQEEIFGSEARHRIVRCGRRFGKTSLGQILTCHEVLQQRRLVGWFVPNYKLLTEVWRELRHRLSPIVLTADNAEHRIELLSGSVIEAWSLEGNKEAGRSRKYHLAIVDECGLIPNLRHWWDSCLEPALIDFGGRAVFLGTPNPIGPDFDEMYDAAAACEDGQWAAFTATTWDNPALPPDELTRIKAKRKEMPEWLFLQEYEGVPSRSSSAFFDRVVIREHTEKYASPPIAVGDIVANGKSGLEALSIIGSGRVSEIAWIDDSRGPWKLWFPMRGDDRPDQNAAWCFGMDIGAGVGAANTVISVGDAVTGQKWAEYACPGVSPDEATRAVAIAGMWFGGLFKYALLQFEVNGPGELVARQLLRCGYPMICGQNSQPGDINANPSAFGWRSTQQSKQTLLEEYRAALARETFKNPSELALKECLTYVFDKNGRLVCIRDKGRFDEDPAGAPHGDRVIADALLYNAMVASGKLSVSRRHVLAASVAAAGYETIDDRIERWERSRRGSGLSY